jgi:aerobic-type carbon monoxide dehydrogenase small subunit (CoxS/CutS family)/CO/xanthine dehydrogenase FAD-binding subunit/carbon monoxide dehydrogenase subunit G
VKAAPFAYTRPSTVDGALAELAASGGEGKVLAGGQSLVPVLAMRLARPSVLVDINGVQGLDQISLNETVLRVGATARQRDVERDERTAAVPLLGLALPWVGHRELRSRGTVCGSLAHADPAAELPAVAACLDATLEIAGPGGRRTVRAGEFFTGAMTTRLEAGDVLVGAGFPVAAPGEGFGFAEFARRHGDFALAGVAVRVRRSPREAVLAAFGVSDRPVVRDVTGLLDASGATEPGRIAEALAEPMTALAQEIVDTGGDAHASAAYRRRLFAALAARELAQAQVRALEDGGHRKQVTDRRTEGPTGQRTRASGPGERRCNGEHRDRGVAGGSGESSPRASTAETRMTVNGVPVVVRLPARVTLADALRDHLGLTGTHLGCEHGICGMCTVLVDGAAARACLLFACQLEGADIVTVEGLGRPGDLHPLQEAFGGEHALQCGFCTPGFLMSAYDLLSRRPGVTQDELPEELSGVLCRCTGYRNILAAVGQVADTYRDGGLPGPRNCGAAALARRSPKSAGVAAPAGGEVLVGAAAVGGLEAPAAPAATADAGGPEVPEVRVPQGPPAFVAEVTSTLAASPDDVWRVLGDVRMVARCLPGAELTDDLGGDRYRGRARVGVGPVRLSFRGVAQVAERDARARTMRVLAQGSDAGGGQTQADIRVTAEPGPAGDGCRLTAEARVYLSGRIAQFGRALAGDVSRRLFEQFATAVEQAVTSGEAPQASPVPPSALRILAGALAGRLRALFRRHPAP